MMIPPQPSSACGLPPSSNGAGFRYCTSIGTSPRLPSDDSLVDVDLDEEENRFATTTTPSCRHHHHHHHPPSKSSSHSAATDSSLLREIDPNDLRVEGPSSFACPPPPLLPPGAPRAVGHRRHRRLVGFGAVEIREYPVIVGDPPSSHRDDDDVDVGRVGTTTCPMTLDWNPVRTIATSVDEHERERRRHERTITNTTTTTRSSSASTKSSSSTRSSSTRSCVKRLTPHERWLRIAETIGILHDEF